MVGFQWLQYYAPKERSHFHSFSLFGMIPYHPNYRFAGLWGVGTSKEQRRLQGCLVQRIVAEDISDAYAEHRLVQEPNGGYLANAKACQDSCKVAPRCKKFTFKTGSNPPGWYVGVESGDGGRGGLKDRFFWRGWLRWDGNASWNGSKRSSRISHGRVVPVFGFVRSHVSQLVGIWARRDGFSRRPLTSQKILCLLQTLGQIVQQSSLNMFHQVSDLGNLHLSRLVKLALVPAIFIVTCVVKINCVGMFLFVV